MITSLVQHLVVLTTDLLLFSLQFSQLVLKFIELNLLLLQNDVLLLILLV